MKILMFCSNPVNGGTARIFYELAASMRSMLCDADKLIACVNQDNPVEIYKDIKDLERLPVYSEAEVCHGMYGGNALKRIVNRFHRKLRFQAIRKHNIAVMQEYLEKNHIDAVIIHNGGYVGDDLCNQMLTAAFSRGERLQHRIYVLHNDMEKSLCSKLQFWTYDKRVSKEATEIVTVSKYTRNRILASSFINKDIKVIYNGISDMSMMPREDKLSKVHIGLEKINVLMIGNFQDNKGQHKFLEAASELNKKGHIYHFTIIGNIYDKDYFQKCSSLIKKFGLEQNTSIYHGIHNASEFIGLFDILAVPSLYDESFGLISVEAMANSRPVVAFACGGIPEIVLDGRNGFIVPVGDSKKMAERIEWLAEHPEDRGHMGEQGRKDYEEKFSAERMASEYMEVLGLK